MTHDSHTVISYERMSVDVFCPKHENMENFTQKRATLLLKHLMLVFY